MSSRVYAALCALILTAAAALRLIDLPQYPPGPHYDEAANLMIARSIAFGGARFFPIVEAYQGREVLYYYLAAPALALFGDSMLSLRLVSALCSLLTVALSMGTARAMFPGRRGRLIALVVGAAMALSFHQVWLGRQAFRAVTLPLTQALALWLLFRGLRAQRWGGWLAAGGAAAGLALYTYMASRLFPLWLAVGGLVLLLADRRALRLWQGAVFFGALALVGAPMAVYALQNPDIFFGRLAEVTQGAEAVTLAESIGLHLRMFFIEGDPYLRYNVPLRPYFTLPEGIVLVVGLALCAWRVRRGGAVEHAAYGLALLAPLMIIPSIISVGGLPPSHMRSLGMVPLIFIALGVGAGALLERMGRVPAAAALVGVLLVGALAVGDLYSAWARRADLFYETDADLAAAAAWLAHGAGGASDGATVYVAARDKGHPTVQIAPVPPVRWLGTDTLFMPPIGIDGLYVFPRSAPPPPEWLIWLEAGRIDELPLAPDGRAAFEAFRVGGRLPALPPDAARTPYMALTMPTMPSIAAGESGWVEVLARIDAPPPFADLTPLLEVLDPHTGDRLFRGDAYMTDTDRWQPGETMLLRLRVAIPPGTPPGRYTLRLAWVARAADEYVTYLDGGLWTPLGEVGVTHSGWVGAVPPARCQDCIFDGAALVGWDMPPELTLRPGESAVARLHWRAEGEPLTMGRGGFCLDDGAPLPAQGLALADRDLAGWRAGETLIERWRIVMPPDLAAGEYTLSFCAQGQHIRLARVRIEGIARRFAPPPFDQRVDAVFGGQIALHGYTLEQTAEGLSLLLVWRSDAPADRDYTVFVHRLDADGNILDQRDLPPAVPTSLWLPGEYISERYAFPPDPRAVALRVGLYRPDDGVRLPLSTGGNALLLP